MRDRPPRGGGEVIPTVIGDIGIMEKKMETTGIVGVI